MTQGNDSEELFLDFMKIVVEGTRSEKILIIEEIES